MKIYTRQGDAGETGLADGSRVGKDDRRVATYGEVDELNAVLGLCRAQGLAEAEDALLAGVQKDLFALGAQLADPKGSVTGGRAKAALTPERIAELERAIDAAEASVPPLRSFILPAGGGAAAAVHLARTVCRRAERAVVALSRSETVPAQAVTYLNRLSDLLFVLARKVNHAAGRGDEPW